MKKAITVLATALILSAAIAGQAHAESKRAFENSQAACAFGAVAGGGAAYALGRRAEGIVISGAAGCVAISMVTGSVSEAKADEFSPEEKLAEESQE